jgi:hypothetical protein
LRRSKVGRKVDQVNAESRTSPSLQYANIVPSHAPTQSSNRIVTRLIGPINLLLSRTDSTSYHSTTPTDLSHMKTRAPYLLPKLLPGPQLLVTHATSHLPHPLTSDVERPAKERNEFCSSSLFFRLLVVLLRNPSSAFISSIAFLSSSRNTFAPAPL